MMPESPSPPSSMSSTSARPPVSQPGPGSGPGSVPGLDTAPAPVADRAFVSATPLEVRRKIEASLARRGRTEKLYRFVCLFAASVGFLFLLFLLLAVGWKSLPALRTHQILLPIEFPSAGEADFSRNSGFWEQQIRSSLYGLFPEVTSRSDKRDLHRFLSRTAWHELWRQFDQNRHWTGTRQEVWLSASSSRTTSFREALAGAVGVVGSGEGVSDLPAGEAAPELSPEQSRTAWSTQLAAQGRLRSVFAWQLFTQADSREPEQAGLLGALIGSAWMLLVTLVLSLPLGVAAAVYLEVFALRTRATLWLETTIHNLAAVPSIVYGLLGLFIFLSLLGFPRSTPLVGGLILSLMTLPTVIITTRVALALVPASHWESVLALGATKMQALFHHILPRVAPAVLTGSIIGLAQALGETAPLLMIGMVAFIVQLPALPTDASTALPVQIYLWASLPERGFESRAAAAILVLLFFLFVMNLTAIFFRHRAEMRRD